MTGIGNIPPGGPPPGAGGPEKIQGPGESTQPRPSETQGPSKSFENVLQGPGETQATPAATNVDQPNFERISARIQDGVDRSLTRDQILESVIDGEIQAAYGPEASHEMVNAVTEAFRNNEQLKSLFNKMYSMIADRDGP